MYVEHEPQMAEQLTSMLPISDGRLHDRRPRGGEPELQRRREQGAQLQERLRAHQVPQGSPRMGIFNYL